MLVLAVLVGAALALVISLGLLALYRLAVLRSMRAPKNGEVPDRVPSEASAAPGTPVRTDLELSFLDRGSPISAEREAGDLHSEVLRAPWRTAWVYAVAGFSSALVFAAAKSVAAGGLAPLGVLLLLAVYAWPVVLTVNLVAATSWRARATTAFAYFLIIAVLGAVAVARSSNTGGGQILLLWTLSNLPATILLLAFLNRRVRAVGPLVLSFMLLAAVGVIIALLTVMIDDRVFYYVLEVTYAVGLSDWFLPLVGALGFVAFATLGWLGLRWIRRRYDRKKISDQSITLDAIWLIFALAGSVTLLNSGVEWMLSGLVAFGVYKLVARIGFTLLRRHVGPAARRETPQLLLLRVFSLGKRSERLFDALTTHWRYAGDIRLIAGPDLANTTIEPHEFLDFVSRKLARRFIDGPGALDLRISEMDAKPDRDGRFRVNDFFCHENTWKMVLSRLVSESDAVLMDLRGFSPQNAGCIYEITELVNVVPLGQVVFVVDDTTDEQFLHETVQHSWDLMSPSSPNRLSSSEALRLFQFTGLRRGELEQLLRALCVAAVRPKTAAPT